MTFVSIVMMDDSIGSFDLELAYPTRLISFSTLSFVSPLMISSVNSLFIEIDYKTKIFVEMMHWIFLTQLHQFTVHGDWLTKQRYFMKWCTEFFSLSSVNSLFIEIDWQNKDIWWNDALNFFHSAPSISCSWRSTDKTKIFDEMMHWMLFHVSNHMPHLLIINSSD